MQVNGKYFSIGFALVTAAILGFGLAVHSRHQKIAALVEKQREAWPKTAEAIEPVLISVDESIRSSSDDNRSIWQAERFDYQSSTVYDMQVRKLEGLTKLAMAFRAMEKDTGSELSKQKKERIQNFIELDKGRDALHRDLLGTITSQVLFLNYPPPVYETLASYCE